MGYGSAMETLSARFTLFPLPLVFGTGEVVGSAAREDATQ